MVHFAYTTTRCALTPGDAMPQENTLMTTTDVTTPTGEQLLANIGQLTIVYEDGGDGDGWVTVSLLELPGAISQGATIAEARENVLDAARELLLSYYEDGTDPQIRPIVGIEIVRAPTP